MSHFSSLKMSTSVGLSKKRTRGGFPGGSAGVAGAAVVGIEIAMAGVTMASVRTRPLTWMCIIMRKKALTKRKGTRTDLRVVAYPTGTGPGETVCNSSMAYGW